MNFDKKKKKESEYKTVTMTELLFKASSLKEVGLEEESKMIYRLLDAMYTFQKPRWMFWVKDEDYKNKIKIKSDYYLCDDKTFMAKLKTGRLYKSLGTSPYVKDTSMEKTRFIPLKTEKKTIAK